MSEIGSIILELKELNNEIKLRNNEFEVNNFKYTKLELIKKDINVDTVDFKHYQSAIRKKAMSEKNKPSNMFKNDIETTDNNKINIIPAVKVANIEFFILLADDIAVAKCLLHTRLTQKFLNDVSFVES